MLVTDCEKLYEQSLILRDHGRLPGDVSFQNKTIGFKYKMSNIQAALGLAQLERIQEFIQKKREIFSWYQEMLKDIQHITLNPYQQNVFNSYWMTTIFWNENIQKKKIDIMNILKKHGVSSRPFFSPLSSLEAFQNHVDTPRAQKENKSAYTFLMNGLNLPSALTLTKNDVENVCEIIKKYIL